MNLRTQFTVGETQQKCAYACNGAQEIIVCLGLVDEARNTARFPHG